MKPNIKRTGDSAFPCTKEQHAWFPGMTLRDYFAAKAMQGWLSTYGADVPQQAVRAENIAMLAYEIADAMLKAREQ